MRSTSLVHATVLAVGLGVAMTAPAMAGDIYLQIPNVTGGSTNANFKGDIPLTAYSQGFTDPATLTGGATGRGSSRNRTTCGAISIAKLIDSTSPDFLQWVTKGTLIPKATVYFVSTPNANGVSTPRYTIVLTNVRVTSITQSDAAGNTAGIGITENISMIAEKFQFTYSTQSVDAAAAVAGGTETFGWDCLTDSPI
jgi:type VI protein secretion system component Hcp